MKENRKIKLRVVHPYDFALLMQNEDFVYALEDDFKYEDKIIHVSSVFPPEVDKFELEPFDIRVGIMVAHRNGTYYAVNPSVVPSEAARRMIKKDV